MTNMLANEIGLLRTLVANLESKPLPGVPMSQEFLREAGLARARREPGGILSIRLPGRDAFNRLSECLLNRIPAMERGAIFANVQTELFNVLAGYVGRDPATIGHADAQSLLDHVEAWFTRLASPRRVFVPCVLTPWPAPRFEIGPVTFVFTDDAARSDFYPGGATPDLLGRRSFDDLLQLMRETHANWLARVSVDGCEQNRGEEVGELAVDLAIVALQLAAPQLDTRSMCRLDSRRGASQKRTLSETNGYYGGGWTRKDPGISIGQGTLAHILQVAAPVVAAVGDIVRSFASGVFRLPDLERAWCDAAYWLHEALAEPMDSIAVAKLETALEVLLRTENTTGSTARLLMILETVFNLRPDDPIMPGSTLTARQFARNVVRDRSRILHGTWSTLNARLASDRTGLEGFVISVVRRAAVELNAYAKEANATDDIEAFLAWLKGRTAAPSSAAE